MYVKKFVLRLPPCRSMQYFINGIHIHLIGKEGRLNSWKSLERFVPGSGVSWEGVPRTGPKLGNSRQSRRKVCGQLKAINMKCGVMHNT